ncbi:MAG TPA: hypothetical protein VHO70_01230 [Chitinispirillaceae bacterium]|nr:hypothetical protein [Chitinispirillaceae bacterium]
MNRPVLPYYTSTLLIYSESSSTSSLSFGRFVDDLFLSNSILPIKLTSTFSYLPRILLFQASSKLTPEI